MVEKFEISINSLEGEHHGSYPLAMFVCYSSSGGFRGVLEVSTEPPLGLHLVIKSTDDRLNGNPLSGYRTKKTAAMAHLSML